MTRASETLVGSYVLLDLVLDDPAVAGHRLLTRAKGRCATYFPTVELIVP